MTRATDTAPSSPSEQPASIREFAVGPWSARFGISVVLGFAALWIDSSLAMPLPAFAAGASVALAVSLGATGYSGGVIGVLAAALATGDAHWSYLGAPMVAPLLVCGARALAGFDRQDVRDPFLLLATLALVGVCASAVLNVATMPSAAFTDVPAFFIGSASSAHLLLRALPHPTTLRRTAIALACVSLAVVAAAPLAASLAPLWDAAGARAAEAVVLLGVVTSLLLTWWARDVAATALLLVVFVATRSVGHSLDIALALGTIATLLTNHLARVRNASEKQQRARQDLFDAMMRFIPTGVFRADLAGRVRYANDTYYTLTGSDQQSLADWLDAVDAADRDRVVSAWSTFVRGQGEFSQAFQVNLLGGRRWIHVRGIPEFESGTRIGYIGTVSDATTEKASEEARARSEALAGAVLDNAVEAIITIDVAGRIQSFNRAAQKIFGYSPEEVIDRNVNMLMPEPYRSEHDQYIARYLDTRSPRIIGIGRELEALRRDGSRFPIYLAVSEVIVADGRSFTGVIRDITAQKAAEEEIRQQHEQLQVTLLNAPLGIATYRFGGLLETTNRAFETISGYTESELRATSYAALVHTDDRAELTELTEKASTGALQQFNLRLRLVRKDGASVTTMCHHALTHDHAGTPDLVIVQVEDLTPRVLAEEAERAHQRQLTHVMRLGTLGEMTAGIAHEINQPLTAISLYARSAARMIQAGLPAPERLHEALRKLEAQALRAGAVIDRIQRLVKNREGERRTVDMSELASDALRLAETDARVNDVEIVADLAPDLPCVTADPIQIEQVLLNLVRNAIDAMRSVDRRNGTMVILRTRSTGSGVETSVVDSGTGVAPDFEPQMFAPFTTTKDSGMGMGLSICRSIVERHGGSLGFRNNPDHGATFYFILPADTSNEH